MGRHVIYGMVLSALFALVACASDDDADRGPSTFAGTPSATASSSPTTSFREVDETPSGACTNEGATDDVRTPGGLAACRGRDGGFAPAEGNEWRCTCTNANWSCTIVHGGLGMISCP